MINNEHINSWKNKSVFMKQLNLNLHEISQPQHNPIHWKPFLEIMRKLKIKSFLDIGCGSGIYYELLKRNFPNIEYTGIDYSEEAIEVAKNQWNYDKFYVKDINEITREYVKNYDVLHFGALFDMLPNSNELLDFILSLNPNMIIISRLEFSKEDEDKISEYIAYDEIKTYKFLHSEKKFNSIVKKYKYSVQKYEYYPNKHVILLYKDDISEYRSNPEKYMIHLLVNYYKTSISERQTEIDFCFRHNILNQFINKIHCFISEKDYNLLEIKSDKINFIIFNNRPSYYDYFKYANENIPDDDIIVISNSDIYFDSSLRFINYNLSSNDVFALTRWGADGNVLNGNEIHLYSNARCSQDTWIYRNKLINLESMNCKFNLGIMACDNRIAYEFHNSGYKVSNPCLDIITYHYHESQHRTITENVPGPVAYINPSTFNYNNEEVNGKN